MKHKDPREVSAAVRSLWGQIGESAITARPELALMFQLATAFCLEAGRDLLCPEDILSLRRIDGALAYARMEAGK